MHTPIHYSASSNIMQHSRNHTTEEKSAVTSTPNASNGSPVVIDVAALNDSSDAAATDATMSAFELETENTIRNQKGQRAVERDSTLLHMSLVAAAHSFVALHRFVSVCLLASLLDRYHRIEGYIVSTACTHSPRNSCSTHAADLCSILLF